MYLLIVTREASILRYTQLRLAIIFTEMSWCSPPNHYSAHAQTLTFKIRRGSISWYRVLMSNIVLHSHISVT